MSKASMLFELETHFPPPNRRYSNSPSPSTVLVALCLAISISLIIPIAEANSTVLASFEENATTSRESLERDQLILVPISEQADFENRLSDRSNEEDRRPIRESSGDGFDEEDEAASGDENENVLTKKDLELIKKQFLRKMGLSGRPPTAGDRRDDLPVYLWDIYDDVVEGATPSSAFGDRFQQNGEHADEIDDGISGVSSARRSYYYYDTVRTFFATGNPLSPTTLRFDIHRLPSNERWVDAELRVPWHHFFSNNTTKSINVSDENFLEKQNVEGEQRKHFIRINLYEVVNETVDILYLIDTKLINVADSASTNFNSRPWTTFDVLSIVSTASLKSNVVKLAVEFVSSASSTLSDFDDFGHSKFLNVVASSSDHERDVERSAAALIMYGFDDDGRATPNKYKNYYKNDDSPRRKRQVNKRQRASNRPRLRANESNNNRQRPLSNRRPSSSNRPNQNLCQRRPLTIRFEDLNWQDWILAPQEYAAYYCSGQCLYPFADGQNATNHAIVQALVNSVSPRAAPKPCCVATETSSISMLYTDIDKNIVIKNYPDMIVEGCGCR